MDAQTPPAPSDAATPNAAEGAGTHSRHPLSAYDETRLANAYLIGKGVEKDPVQAAYWYRKAADAGNPDSQNQLGYLYLTGIGLQRDEAEAAKWFARAMAGGSPEAKANLALLYLKGSGKMRDTGLGLDLLRQAAEQGNAQAQDILGILYWKGDGVPKDDAAAEKWLRRSAKQGNASAQFALGDLNSVNPAHKHDLPRAVKLLRRSAHSGYIPAQYLLGVLLVNHPDIAQKHSGEGIAMLTRAAESGMWQASAALGVLARSGLGMPRDIGVSFRWFVIESRQGSPDVRQQARSDLESCRQELNADEQKQEIDAAESWLARHNERDIYVLENGLVIPMRAAFVAAPEQSNEPAPER